MDNTTRPVQQTADNTQPPYEVGPADLPLHCPMDNMNLWDTHPRVFLPIEATGKANCPYCGKQFVLTNS